MLEKSEIVGWGPLIWNTPVPTGKLMEASLFVYILCCEAQVKKYTNESLPVDERVEGFLSKMLLDEKLSKQRSASTSEEGLTGNFALTK